MNTDLKKQLLNAVKLAKEGNWDASHYIVQDHHDSVSCWIHAVLHKIEGDESNSRYWYAHSNTSFEAYKSSLQELDAIKALLI